MQTLKAEITIPSDYVVIHADDYKRLQDTSYLAVGDMDWLCETTGIKTKSRLSDILYKARLDYDLEGFVRFPDEGGRWGFVKKPMTKFIENNFFLFKKAGS